MVNCGSTYSLQQCTAYVKRPLDADSGIVGPGAIAGFAATATLTFGAIILGYLTKSLPEHCLTDLDHKTVEIIARSPIGSTCAKAWRTFIRVSRKCLFLRPPNEAEKLNEDQRREALKKFILTLSDQQLVTGIAILLACFVNWCRTSVYELNMVVSLAWFSSTTHLATLDVLQDYFQRNRVVRNWRMIGMVIIVLLLMVGQLATGFYYIYDLPIPLPCVTYLSAATTYKCNGTIYYTEKKPHENGHFYHNGTLYNTNLSFNNCTLSPGENQYAVAIIPFSFIESVVVVAYLMQAYVSAILRTIPIAEKATLTLSHLMVFLFLKADIFHPKQVSMEVINDELVKYRAKRKTKWDQKITRPSKHGPAKKLQRLIFYFTVYRESFLCHIGGLIFAWSYGVTQISVYRWAISGVHLDAGNNRIDFGQIVPLVLLVLPLLAAAEIFHENDDKEKKEDLNADIALGPVTATDAEPDNILQTDDAVSAETSQLQHSPTNLSTIRTTEAAPNMSHRLEDHQDATAENVDSGNGESPHRTVYAFLGHATVSVALGILLNMNTIVVILVPIVALLTLWIPYISSLREILFTGRKISAELPNNKLEVNRRTGRNTRDDTELSAVPHEPYLQNNTTTLPSPSRLGTAHDQSVAMENSDDSLLHENQPRASDSLQGCVSAEKTPEFQEREAVDDEGDENQSFASPSRQDTESGLRQRREAANVANNRQQT